MVRISDLLHPATVESTSISRSISLQENYTYPKRIQAPAVPVADQAQNRAEVVREDDAREPPAVDEARGLEDLLVLLEQLRRALGVGRRDAGRILEVPALVELQQHLRDVLYTHGGLLVSPGIRAAMR